MIYKILTIIFSVLFIGIMFGSLFHVTMQMTPAVGEGGCPFMASGESICFMNAVDHISAWKENFLTTPLLLLILGIISLVLLLVRTYPRHSLPLDAIYFFSPSYFFIQRMRSVPRRSLQSFFTRGILHPKLH